MKVLLITVRSDYGGGPRHIHQLVEHLPEDIELFMAFPSKGEPYAKMWNNNGRIGKYVDIPYRRFSIVAFWNIVKFVKHNNIDIVHSHGQGAGLYSRLLKVFCPSIKVVHTFHGISDVYESCIKDFMAKVVGQFFAPLADLYICVSNGERNMALMRRYSSSRKTIVIYNGIADGHAEGKHSFHSPIRIVTLSRFDYQKNMDSMFRIARHWIGSDSVRFVWVGDGKDKKRLEKWATEESVPIDFMGFSSNPMQCLLSSDLYLSTSRFEGLPYGLIEAASVGLPILATDVKGNNEVVHDGCNGFLFVQETEAVGYIQKFLEGDIDFESMSKHSIAIFKENFTEEKMITSITDVYFSLLRGDI